MEYNSGRKNNDKKFQEVKKLSIEQYKARTNTTRTVRFASDKKITSNSQRSKIQDSLSDRQILQTLNKDEVIPGLQDDSNSDQEMNVESSNEKIFLTASMSPDRLSKKTTNAVEEPEILTLSSDEDEPSTNSLHPPSSTYCRKEPIIMKNMTFPPYLECPTEDVGSICVSVSCRSIRIGSHKFIPTHSVSFSKYFLKFTAPLVGHADKHIGIHVPLACIVKMLCSLEPGYTSIFVYCTPPFASHLRHQLHMKEDDGAFFDPCSDDETQKRLVIFIDKISETLISHFRSLYKHRRSFLNTTLLEELTKEEVDNILLSSSSPEIHSLLKKTATVETACKTLLVYPPLPSKGRITINVGDYECLGEEQFLNDVVIDFYLKWLHLEKLPEVHRARTHVFSTFFYKRLTAKPKKGRRNDPHEMDESLAPAQKRHARVKSWTKGINIFEKDFVLIPINERSHWFMAVICYPGMKINQAEKPVPPPTAPTRLSSRTRNKFQEQLLLELDFSDRDEAESDEELNGIDEFRDGKFGKNSQDCEQIIKSVKHPCILIFDSLKGSNRSRIVSTLREYLEREYEERFGVARKFTKFNMEGFLPQVPQQLNYSDCGVYMLQFAECFFDSPIKNYKLPIRSLEDWFPQEIVLGKREDIAKLIQSLIRQANIPNRHAIPEIKFPSRKKPSSESIESPDQEAKKGNKLHDEELHGNDFHPISIPATGKWSSTKKISLNLSSKTIATAKDMRAELDKYVCPPVSNSLELIKSSYLESSADDSLAEESDSKVVADDDIYGDLDLEPMGDKRPSYDDSGASSSTEDIVPCAKKIKISQSPEITSVSEDSYKKPR